MIGFLDRLRLIGWLLAATRLPYEEENMKITITNGFLAIALSLAAATQMPAQTLGPVKITVQVFDPASQEGRLLPQTAALDPTGNPVFHLSLPESPATFQVLANSTVILHANRKASVAVDHPDLLTVPSGSYVFPSDVQAIYQAKKAGSAGLTVTYAATSPECTSAAPNCSSNWSGYVMNGNTFTGITGQWVVPTVSSTAHGASCTWVGIGGWGTGSIIQAGTEQDYSPELSPLEGATYYAWYELFPASQVNVSAPRFPSTTSSYPVSPGDVMQVTITPSAGTIVPPAGQAGKWHVEIADLTKKWTYTATETYSGDLTSAEWIEEATAHPSLVASNIQMADYVEVEFNFFDQVATNNGALQSVDFKPANEVWLNQNGSTGVFSTPSAPSGDGKGFYVTYTVGSPNSVFPPGPWIQTQSPLPPALVGQPYSQTLVVNQAASPVWSVQTGALPAGLTLGASSGAISGTPTQVGQNTFSVAATDSTNGSSTGNVPFTLSVGGTPMGNLDVNCLGISPPVSGAVLHFAIDGGAARPCSPTVISLPAGAHRVTMSVTGSTQVFNYSYAGACGPSGQFTLNLGDAAQCSLHAQTLSSFENACPQGTHCCSPTVNGCASCISTKLSCP